MILQWLCGHSFSNLACCWGCFYLKMKSIVTLTDHGGTEARQRFADRGAAKMLRSKRSVFEEFETRQWALVPLCGCCQNFATGQVNVVLASTSFHANHIKSHFRKSTIHSRWCVCCKMRKWRERKQKKTETLHFLQGLIAFFFQCGRGMPLRKTHSRSKNSPTTNRSLLRF